MAATFAFYTSKGAVCGIFRNFIDGWKIDHNVISSLFIFKADYEGINIIFFISSNGTGSKHYSQFS
jgi:hypothetical protein